VIISNVESRDLLFAARDNRFGVSIETFGTREIYQRGSGFSQRSRCVVDETRFFYESVDMKR